MEIDFRATLSLTGSSDSYMGWNRLAIEPAIDKWFLLEATELGWSGYFRIQFLFWGKK